MSTHKHIDQICVAVLVCTVLITALFMNGSRLGLETVKDGDAAGSTDSAYFTKNDRDGSWTDATATRITLLGDEAAVSGGGAYVYDGDVVIAQAGRYVVTGSLNDGSIRVSAESGSKVWIMLSGADITCSDDAAIRVEQADKVFLTLAEGTENSLTSGAEYSEAALADNTGGALYSHDDLTINGSGSLRITAAYKHGIDANDELVITGGDLHIEAPDDGIHVNEGLRIENATLRIRAGDEGVNVQGSEALLYIASGDIGIESTGTGLKSAHDVRVEGGTLNIGSATDGVHSEGSVTVAGGSLTIDAGDDGVHGVGDVTVTGGALTVESADDGVHSKSSVTVTGGELSISAGDDGVHADQSVSISGGSLLIRECYEGIEALTIDVSGGTLEIYPTDDGLNANGGSSFGGMFGRPGEGQTDTQAAQTQAAVSETWIHISGGSITIVNDTARDADGLDANGDIVISGGTIRVSLTSSSSNNAIDYGSESGGSLIITGGDLVACGSATMAEGFSEESTQCAVLYNVGYNVPAGTEVCVKDAAGNVILRYTPPCMFSSVSLSAPAMKLGESYTVMLGDKEEQISLESITVTYGDSVGMGGMGWGSMRQRGENGEGGAFFRGRSRQEGSEQSGDGTNAGQPGVGPGMGGAMPPDVSGPPADFDGALPDPSSMPAPPDMNGGQRPESDGRPEQAPQETAAPAEEADAEPAAAAELPAVGPQPVSPATWVMIGACVLALLFGLLFALKYRA